VISRTEMLPLLVEASPEFKPTWREFLAEWSEEPGPPPHYLALSDFARHLSGVLAREDEATLQRVFAAVERLIIDGDPYVNEAAIVGLLEDLQNTNLHDRTTPEQYERFLLPQSRRWWEKLKAFWERGQLLTEE
jgi:hypothetical protein